MSPVLYGRGPLGRDTRTSEGEALACVEALFAKTHATWNVTCGESLEYSVSQQSLLRVAATSHCELIDQASRWIPESLRALWRVVVLGMGSCCAAHIYANCKHWNGIVCQLMEAFPSTVRYFKSFEVLLGYRTSLHDSRTALKGWGAFRPVLAAPHAKYLDTIAKVVEDLVFKPASECFDLDTFLADRGNYLVDGSAGRGAESVTLRDGTRVTFRRKCDAYCVKTSKQLQALTRSTGAAAKVMPKVDERGKSRAIVGYPNSSYLRCSWLTHCIDMGRSFVYSPLEKGQKWLTDLANTLSKLEGTRWAIDQSSFDEHQHPLYVTHALRCVLEKCVEALGSCPEAVELCRLELEDFATKVFVDPRGRVLARGVPFLPSGHRLTSMLGTILNRASFLLVKELAELDGPSWHMGDDILYVGTGNWERIRSSYSYLGLEVNRSKSLISADVGEFLRMLFGRHTVMTYPVRILSSILWISPQSQAGFQNRVRGVSDLLRKGKVRGLVVPSTFWPCYISKCAPRGQKAMYTRFVRSPLCVGGLGWGWVKVFAIPKVRTDYVGIYRAIGIESECGWALARSAASLKSYSKGLAG